MTERYDLPLRCQCGSVSGTALGVGATTGNRVICYCDDCQAFARFLGRSSAILDKAGGTDILQLPASTVVLTVGLEKVGCVRLRDGGLYRWYASCCNTPIGNTLGPAWPFVGLIHSFIAKGQHGSVLLGPIRARLHERFAVGELPSKTFGRHAPLGALVRITWLLVKWRLCGQHRPSPFFNSRGQPLATPRVLQRDS